MARPRNHEQHPHTAVENQLRSIAGLLSAVGGAVAGSSEVRAAAAGVKRSASVTGRKISSKVRAAWAKLTPAERKARIAKVHAWRKTGRGATVAQ